MSITSRRLSEWRRKHLNETHSSHHSPHLIQYHNKLERDAATHMKCLLF